jgi:phosphatidylglycerol:prolipoprotein diacylglycerol transferase
VYPILFAWGDFVLPAWHTLYALGALAALLALRVAGKRLTPEIDPVDLSRIFAVCYVAGYFGARALSILVEEPQLSGLDAWLALLKFGPMTFYGGALGAAAAGTAYAAWQRLPKGTILDLGLPAAALALGFGRIGCFLNGDDYGRAAPLGADGTAPWWAVTFPVLKDGIARWPVQLFEAGAAFVIAGVMLAAFRRVRASLGPGGVAYLTAILYANVRFLLEFLRDDFRGSVAGTWVSTSQFISLVILMACLGLVPFFARRLRVRDAAAPMRRREIE